MINRARIENSPVLESDASARAAVFAIAYIVQAFAASGFKTEEINEIVLATHEARTPDQVSVALRQMDFDMRW